MLTSVGFPASYECPSEISAGCVSLNVHSHPCGPTSGFWECMWGDLGRIFELICRRLGLSFRSVNLLLLCYFSVVLSKEMLQ